MINNLSFPKPTNILLHCKSSFNLKRGLTLASLFIIMISNQALADSEKKSYIKLYGGLSHLSDKSFTQEEVSSNGATGEAKFNNGFLWGGAIGYKIKENFLAEIAWDYSSNNNENISFSDGNSYESGNFASSIFFLNGYYQFIINSNLKPYLGFGLGYVQEIDLDLEKNGAEDSYSDNNNFAYQFIIGSEYKINNNFSFSSDLRYLRVDNIDLTQETGSAKIGNIDYNPITLSFGLNYYF